MSFRAEPFVLFELLVPPEKLPAFVVSAPLPQPLSPFSGSSVGGGGGGGQGSPPHASDGPDASINAAKAITGNIRLFIGFPLQ